MAIMTRPNSPTGTPLWLSALSPALRSALVWGAVALLLGLAYRSYGWHGVLAATGAITFWLLLHFNRVLRALKRTANRPIGYVDSAVMLNAKLKVGDSLLHVLALTRALGQRLSAQDAQPEVFCWTDAGASSVTCTFMGGKLARFELQRPAA
jgi:hypothetical protein